MSTSNPSYFVLFSKHSRNSVAGLRPDVMCAYGREIIDAAARELARSGESWESMAGIEWAEDADGNMRPARELTDAEVFRLSVDKLGDDGRLYATFGTDAAGAAAFISAAKCHGLEDTARVIVDGRRGEIAA